MLINIEDDMFKELASKAATDTPEEAGRYLDDASVNPMYRWVYSEIRLATLKAIARNQAKLIREIMQSKESS